MKFPVETRKYMRGALTIKVWFETSMKCRVEYGLYSIDLPRHIDELRSGLRGVADFEEAKRLYKIITMEVNDMLREYYLKHIPLNSLVKDGMIAEQFHFAPVPEHDTVINIMSGATPMLDAYAPNYYTDYYISSYEPPSPEYVSLEEFEEKRRNGELRSGQIYCVLN